MSDLSFASCCAAKSTCVYVPAGVTESMRRQRAACHHCPGHRVGDRRMAGALAGLKIVDMTVVALGPYATMLLAEQGAEIIKVEPPEGDTTRRVGPSKVN